MPFMRWLRKACFHPIYLISACFILTGWSAWAQSPVCAESYLSSSDGHSGTDYGYAINHAIQAQSLTADSFVNICVAGDHPTWTPIQKDRPTFLQFAGSRLIPQSGGASGAWGSAPVTLTGCTLTAGSTVVTCPTTAGITTGMAVGGIGVLESTYVACAGTLSGTNNTCTSSSTQFTMSLPATIHLEGITNGTATVTGASTLRGLATSQGVTGSGIPAGTTISALHYGGSNATDTQGFTLSNAATSSLTPVGLTITGNWIATLTAQAVAPVFSWVYNSSALRNTEGQNIGGDVDNLWIIDPAYTGAGEPVGRSLTGVQCVQMYGWDQQVINSLRCNGILGSALILGGNVPATAASHGIFRESTFISPMLYDSGEYFSGQPVIENMTGSEGCPGACASGADENNQIGFIGAHVVCPASEAMTIGTFNSSHTVDNGPRLVWFDNNFQFEGCSHTGINMDAPVPVIHSILSGGLQLTGGEIAKPGYGQAVFQNDNITILSVHNSLVFAASTPKTYTVSSQGGSPTITIPAGGFDSTGLWDGVGAQLNDGGGCTPCNVYLLPTGAVSSDGKTITLAHNLQGSTINSSATLTIGMAGYYQTSFGTVPVESFDGNSYGDQNSASLSLLGLPSAVSSWVNAIAINRISYNSNPNLLRATNFTGNTTVTGTLGVSGATSLATLGTNSNCSSSASPAICSTAPAGSVTIAVGSTSVVVQTTAVTAKSQIYVVQDDSLGTKLGVTCYTGINTAPRVTSRVAGTSFTITATAPVSNPGCYSYWIVN